jgi:putative flippase GtrA
MVHKVKKIAKYIISGGTAAVVDLAALYVFVEWFHMWYVLSAIIAFLIAFCFSFTLQKFWTFKDREVENVHKQATVYFVVSVVNLGVNTLLIYLFVEYLHLHYFVSQIIAGGLLAVSSFFIYSIFIFPKKTDNTLEAQNSDNL